MGKNKIKISKEIKINEQKPQITLTKEQKLSNLVNNMNNFMYESLQSGNIKLHDPQNTAKNLIRRSNKFLFSEILKGEININQNQTPFHFIKRKSRKCCNDKQSDDHQDEKIATNNFLQIKHVNNNLRQSYINLQREKQLQRNYEKKLQQKARQFIVKVQKQKQQFEEKLKNKKSKSRLNVRAYSQDTIRIMKQKLEQKIMQKRKQLNDKIENIQKRKVQRVQNQVNNQISYWQKVKKYQSLKHFSVSNKQETKFFPQINLPRSITQRQTSQLKKNIPYSKSGASQLSARILNKKFQNIDNYVLKAKLKLQNFQSKQKHHQSGSKKSSLIQSQHLNNIFLRNSIKRKQDNPQNHQTNFENIYKAKQIVESPHHMYIKVKNTKSLSKIKSQRSYIQGNSKNEQNQKNLVDNQLQIKASILRPNKNLVQSSLQSSWIQTLNKIKLHQIDKIKGLTNLSAIQKRLDKIDQQGMVNRLKLKAHTIHELENNEKIISNHLKIDIENDFDKDLSQKNVQSQKIQHIRQQRPKSKESLSMTSSKNQFIINQQMTFF